MVDGHRGRRGRRAGRVDLPLRRVLDRRGAGGSWRPPACRCGRARTERSAPDAQDASTARIAGRVTEPPSPESRSPPCSRRRTSAREAVQADDAALDARSGPAVERAPVGGAARRAAPRSRPATARQRVGDVPAAGHRASAPATMPRRRDGLAGRPLRSSVARSGAGPAPHRAHAHDTPRKRRTRSLSRRERAVVGPGAHAGSTGRELG